MPQFLRDRLRVWLLVLLLFSSHTCRALEPVVITSSGEWDGADGPWSTFEFGVGTPTQTFRGHPALSFGLVLLPYKPEGCSKSICEMRNNFNHSSTETWEDREKSRLVQPLTSGFYNISNSSSEDATLGIDSMTLAHSSREVRIERQIIAEFTSYSDLHGLFGMADTLVSSLVDIGKPLMSSLNASRKVPGSSFSYTSGSVNKENAPASLILGGYDASRFRPESSLNFGLNEHSHPLSVEIASISFEGRPRGKTEWHDNNSLFPLPAALESATPYLWLPENACKTFEEYFDLEWDENLKLYLINSSTHGILVEQNPRVIFSIQSSTSETPVTHQYILPYSAFDLNVSYPIIGTPSSHYFPLKRAYTTDTYFLGRTFLQETYISVDYSRQIFNISEAIYDPKAPLDIQPIIPLPSQLEAPPKPWSSEKEAMASLGAGLGFSIPIFILVAIGLLVVWRDRGKIKKRTTMRKSPAAATTERSRFEKPELDAGANVVLAETMGKEKTEIELMGREIFELETVKHEIVELEVFELRHGIQGSPDIGKTDGFGRTPSAELSGSPPE